MSSEKFPRYSERHARGGKEGSDADSDDAGAYVSNSAREEAKSLRAMRDKRRQERILDELASDIRKRMKTPVHDYMKNHPFRSGGRGDSGRDPDKE